jgi:polynucleotide 5'-hydroxyl-kinase GRC3/NOL9
MYRLKGCTGPPFTHPTLPVNAHYLGATSPRSSPLYYLAAIQAALDAYRLDVQVFSPNFTPNNEDVEDVDEDDRITNFIPLVINTMGWTKGLGADLNQKIEDMAQATDVYDIQVDSTAFENQAWFPSPLSKTAKERYPSPDLGRDVKLHLLTAIPPSVLSANYTAADHRALSILSYFHAIFPSPRSMLHVQADTLLLGPLSDTSLTAHTWDTSLPLLAQPPYEVDSRAFRNLVLTGAGSEDVVPAEMGIVLNSAVVGLVTCQFDSELDPGGAPPGNQKTRTGIPYTQGRAQPSPAMSNCLGIALIRSTSTSLSEGSSVETLLSDSQVGMQAQMQMHILTPLPSPYLSQVKIVVKGEMELPVWGWLDHRVDAADRIAGVEQGKVPYLQLGKGPNGAVGGERRRVRRNLMRRAQM